MRRETAGDGGFGLSSMAGSRSYFPSSDEFCRRRPPFLFPWRYSCRSMHYVHLNFASPVPYRAFARTSAPTRRNEPRGTSFRPSPCVSFEKWNNRIYVCVFVARCYVDISGFPFASDARFAVDGELRKCKRT